MQVARVMGRATSTVKHPSLQGWRLLVVQPQKADGSADGPPLLAIDELGSDIGTEVIITSDGKAVREAMGSNQTPVRWMVLGLPDTHLIGNDATGGA